MVLEHRLRRGDTLADAGFEVLEMSNAAEASERVPAWPRAALLVTIVQMTGGMDGFALSREAAERWPGMHIVVGSADVKPRLGQKPEGARWLDKPHSAELVMRSSRRMGAEA